jgi:hypothetical protein
LLVLLGWLLYPLSILFLGGKYRNSSIEDFSQFVWIFSSSFFSEIRGQVGDFLLTFNIFHIVIISFIGAVLLYLRSGEETSLIMPEEKRIFIVIFIYFIFLFLMGYYAERLTLGLSTMILVFLLSLLNRYLESTIMRHLSLLMVVLFFINFYGFQGILN